MTKVVEAIDRKVRELEAARPPRGYLGASSLGKRCKRQVWYGFRWAYQEKHLGRLLRLFERGHEEEDRFIRYLRQAGAEVQDYSQRLMYKPERDQYTLIDWEDDPDRAGWVDVHQDKAHTKRATDRNEGPKQWEFKDHEGHYGGHTDGRLRWPGVLPEGWGLLECKTANDKSYKVTVDRGVLTAKPEHWVQMQKYMHYFGLKWALYLVVNKNDDHIHEEIVYYRPEIAEQYIDLAGEVIYSKDGPKRLSNDPSWFECRYCPFREICHYDDQPQKNCRSCAFARPDAGGIWYCDHYRQTIPTDFIPSGCNDWSPIK